MGKTEEQKIRYYEKKKQWRKENSEKYNQYQRDYYSKTREQRNAQQREKYASDPEYAEKCKAAAKKRLDTIRQERGSYLSALKMEKGCIKCGYREHPAALDFDHRNPKEKLFIISSYGRRPWDLVLEELKKCDVVCANCHRIKSAENWKAEH